MLDHSTLSVADRPEVRYSDLQITPLFFWLLLFLPVLRRTNFLLFLKFYHFTCGF